MRIASCCLTGAFTLACSSSPGSSAAESCPMPNDSETSPLYDHRVQKATSSDGVIFDPSPDILLEHASVPDAVVRADGNHWIYAVNGNPGQHAIFIAQPN